MTIATVLFDLDGVLRHFDPSTAGRIEEAHGLRRGVIEAAAFSADLLRPVTVGEITNDEWVAAIGERIGSTAAASAWRRQPFTVDPEMLELARALRITGIHVSIFSNATDGLREELAASEVIDVVECVFNSSELGRAKPSAEAYLEVAATLNVDPATVLFVDDRLDNVRGATAVGMAGHHHQGRGPTAADSLRRVLRDAGLGDCGGTRRK